VNISEQPFIIKLGFSSGPTHFVKRRRLIARVTSVTEICGIFRTSEQVKSELFGELNNNNNNNNNNNVRIAKLVTWMSTDWLIRIRLLNLEFFVFISELRTGAEPRQLRNLFLRV
jgi:hypothetical protein